MEKAVLKTLVYSDIFDYPLLAWEIHKWLIQKKTSLKEVEKSLKDLIKKNKVQKYKDFYFLKGRRGLVKKRILREKISKSHFDQINSLSKIFKIIPFIKLVGVTGSLAVKNSDKDDDIDLIIVTEKNRLFLSRLLLLFLLELLGVRRKKQDDPRLVYKKICANIILDEGQLAQYNKNIYLAHEVLQMIPLWQKGNVYSKFLEDNYWVFDFLPNWLSTQYPSYQKPSKSKKSSKNFLTKVVNFTEEVSKNFQLNYMGKPTGKERISENALYFHPIDYQEKVLKEYKIRLDKALGSKRR